MIPILYNKNETDFQNNGIGGLSDAISCIVTEERNGVFELEMKYPVKGKNYKSLGMASIILADPGEGRTAQRFVVYKISKPINGIVTVYAEHKSYRLSHIPVSPFTAENVSAALNGLETHAAEECPFRFWTDKTTSASFKVEKPASIRSCLGGVEGSILDVYGGEYEFDNDIIRLYNHRGQDNGVTLRYGKNILDIKQEENIQNTVTGVYPFWQGGENEYLELPEKVLHAENAGSFPFPRTIVLDCSQDFDEKPTVAQLRGLAQKYITASGIGIPSVSISVSFVALWQTEEYKDIVPLEQVRLCDTVTVEFEDLGVSATAKVVKTVYDVLLDRYSSIELGETRRSLANDIADQRQSIVNQWRELLNQEKEINKKANTTFVEQAVASATEWITGANGGAVVLRKDANGKPYELLVMDTEDIAKAINVWRWNKNGLGYSSKGYNGPYETAITKDGQIVADFIVAGTMLANRIKGGTLILGGPGNGDGVCEVNNASGKKVVGISSEGIEINAGKVNINSSAKDTVIMQFTNTETNPDGTVTKRKTVLTPMGIEVYMQDEYGNKNMMKMAAGSVRGGTFSGTIDDPGGITIGSYLSAGAVYAENGASGSFRDQSGNRVKVSRGIITEIG